MSYMNDVVIGNEKLVPTAHASKITGYSKDYVGQLCREEKIECRRVSGLWYVSEGSIREYQRQGVQPVGIPESKEEESESVKELRASHEKPKFGIKTGNVRDDTFTYDGIEYISTSRAADVTGYAQDYVGQLARNSEIEARKVGRRWFVGRKALVEHKKHNDSLLAEVQAQASGVRPDTRSAVDVEVESEDTEVLIDIHKEAVPGDINFNVRYVSETEMPLVPKLSSLKNEVKEYTSHDIPISTYPAPQVKGGIVGSEISRPGLTEQRITRVKEQSRVEVRKNAPHVRDEHYSEEESQQRVRKRSSLTLSLTISVFLLSGGGLGTYAYFLGIPEWLSILLSTLDTSSLEMWAEYLPGRDIDYSR